MLFKTSLSVNTLVDENLTFYHNKGTFKLEDITYVEKVTKIDFSKMGLVGFHNLTLNAAYKAFVLGLPVKSVEPSFLDGNTKNLSISNITINGKPIDSLLKFRSENSTNLTPQESRLFTFLLKSEFSKKLFTSRTKYNFIHEASCPHQDGFYLADFFLTGLSQKVIIELDGKQHYTERGLIYDNIRDNTISEVLGVKILRITNQFFDMMSDVQLFSHINNFINQSTSELKNPTSRDSLILTDIKEISIVSNRVVEVLKILKHYSFKFAIISAEIDKIKVAFTTSGNYHRFRIPLKLTDRKTITTGNRYKLNF